MIYQAVKILLTELSVMLHLDQTYQIIDQFNHQQLHLQSFIQYS